MRVFHIRKQLAPRGGSQFYRDRSMRDTATLCGAPVTDLDVRFKDRYIEQPELKCCADCASLKETN